MNKQPTPAKRLKPFRPWQVLHRYLYTLEHPGSDGRTVSYTVEVITTGDDTVQLYADGMFESRYDLPASIPVCDGHIEVKVSLYGVTRVHLVTDDGIERRLTPVAGTIEDRRRRLHLSHPKVSRAIGWVAIVILVVNLMLAVPFALELATQIPKIEARFGSFVSPLQLPAWLNFALVVAGILAAMERLLTLRHNKILDIETIWTAS